MTCHPCVGTGWVTRRMWSYRLHDWIDVPTTCGTCDGTGDVRAVKKRSRKEGQNA